VDAGHLPPAGAPVRLAALAQSLPSVLLAPGLAAMSEGGQVKEDPKPEFPERSGFVFDSISWEPGPRLFHGEVRERGQREAPPPSPAGTWVPDVPVWMATAVEAGFFSFPASPLRPLQPSLPDVLRQVLRG
jgi:hypothetical protein